MNNNDELQMKLKDTISCKNSDVTNKRPTPNNRQRVLLASQLLCSASHTAKRLLW